MTSSFQDLAKAIVGPVVRDVGCSQRRASRSTYVGAARIHGMDGARRWSKKERSMFFRKLAAVSIPLCIAGTALAKPAPSSSRADTPEKVTKLNEALSVVQAVSQWSRTLSEMADKRAKSDLVKDYARSMANTSANADAKLRSIAEKGDLEIKPLDSDTEQGKSLMDRMKAETTLLGSLEGDAFDKEYMTLVTNTQQSVIHVLEKNKAAAKDPEVKQFLGDMATTVQGRLKTAQDVMAKVYGDTI
jgi:predicted outer membrane protein